MQNFLGNLLKGDATPDSNEIRTPIIKLRGKTLIFANTIYQISNISILELLDLSTEKPIPAYFGWLLLIGIGLLFVPGNIKIMGVVTLLVLVYFFFRWQQTKLNTRYGLSIRTNGGFRTIILSGDKEFLTRIILVLNNVMNSDQLTALTFNLDQSQITEDRSINVQTMNNSNIVGGDVTGDVVSNA